jgi:hypothetical protein
LEQACVRSKITELTEDEQNVAAKEVEDTVTPEMVEAAKLVLASSDYEPKSLEHSIGEVYVAMAAEDRIATNEKKNISQIKHDNRTKYWLYFGTFTMIILGVILLMMKIFI